MKGLNLNCAILFSSLALSAAYATDTSQMIASKDDWGRGWSGQEAVAPSDADDSSPNKNEKKWQPEDDDPEDEDQDDPSFLNPRTSKDTFGYPP